MMAYKEFQKYLDRDGAHCYRCGGDEGLVPQHRVNRGMGGRPSLDIPSNIITFCGECNGLIESNPEAADLARAHGWKLRDVSPARLPSMPVYDRFNQQWFFLDDNFGRSAA